VGDGAIRRRGAADATDGPSRRRRQRRAEFAGLYSQAAWWNRIPTAAWCLMGLIAIACNGLLGYGAQGAQRINAFLFLIVPLTTSIAVLLIAEIDSPRGGFIRVLPTNLNSLAHH
jgi:hypothetical protein